jgi:predicted O-methyltransferase YrrM
LSGRPNFEDPYGLTTNPLRLIFMMGAVWRLAQDGGKQIDVLEIGSWCGASALTWGEAMELYTAGGRLTCIDPWRPYTDLAANPDELNRLMNDQLVTDRAFEVFTANMAFLPRSVPLDVRRGTSRKILPGLPANSFDLIYIDGDHVYDAVADDIGRSVPLLRDGGILCGDDLELQAHDCAPAQFDQASSVERLWDDRLGDFFHPGVTRAVSEALGRVSCWHGFWAMRKADDGWRAVSLDGMPMRIPAHLPAKSLMGLKAYLMKNGLI